MVHTHSVGSGSQCTGTDRNLFLLVQILPDFSLEHLLEGSKTHTRPQESWNVQLRKSAPTHRSPTCCTHTHALSLSSSPFGERAAACRPLKELGTAEHAMPGKATVTLVLVVRAAEQPTVEYSRQVCASYSEANTDYCYGTMALVQATQSILVS